MFERREFLKKTASSAALWMLAPTFLEQQSFASGATAISDDGFHFSSSSMEVQLSKSAPEFTELNIDCLGLSKRGANVFQTASVISGYVPSVSSSSGVHRVEYRAAQ
jgi:hypothetical protein